jgi:acyl-coenzyme A synthetase/AMP-(fatty) acid ligase
MILEKIFEYARSEPQRTAMHYRGYTISYGEFAFWIAKSRHFLTQHDLPPGSIAVQANVSCRLDSWAMDLAARSLGVHTIAVRMAEELPQLRLRNVSCVITTIPDIPIEKLLPGGGYKLMRVPHPMFLGVQAGAVPELAETRRPEGGHILLTSGTTGNRKKVMLSSETLSLRTERQSDIYGITGDSIVNIFDFAMWTGAGYKLPLSVWNRGAAIVFHQDQNPHISLTVAGLTHAIGTPVKIAEALKAPAAELRKNPELLLSAAGAPLTRSLAEAARAQLTPNIYSSIASTEVGIWGLTRIDTPEDLGSHQIHPSIEVQVVDDADQPLPPGQVGVIRVRAADGVNGYLDDEASSRQIFRHGYFYPGDLGEFAGGRLVLHGRASSVIVLRGNKVVVDPIERALQEKLGAEAICILSLPGESNFEDLHVVIQSRRVIGTAEVESEISARMLAPESVSIHHFDEMPRNEMGKIDRLAVRRAIQSRRAATAA